jgi:hypothetical protein
MGTWDTIKATAAGTFGFVTQLSNLDIFFKVSVGFLTCTYLTMKIVELAIRWRKGANKDE